MQDVDQLPETRCESTVPRACSVDMAALVQIRMRSISSTVTVSARPVVDGLIAGGGEINDIRAARRKSGRATSTSASRADQQLPHDQRDVFCRQFQKPPLAEAVSTLAHRRRAG